MLALKTAASTVRQATEPRQVYQTIAQEVRKLGFSLLVFSYTVAEQVLRFEHRAFVGGLQAIWLDDTTVDVDRHLVGDSA